MLKKLSISICLFLLISSYSFAQPIIDWQTLYDTLSTDHTFSDIVANPDGTYLAVGEKQGNQSLYDYDLLIAKIDAQGDTLWSNTIGDAIEDKGHALVATPDGGYIIAGTSSSVSGLFAETHGMHDVWILKINNAGEMLWSRTWGGSNEEMVYDITADNNGNYYLVGYTESNDFGIISKGFVDGLILKINEAGDIIWQKNYGGSGFDRFRAVLFDTTSQSLVVVGSTSSSDQDLASITPNGGNDMWVTRIDPVTGNPTWTHTYGGSLNDIAISVVKSSDGNLVILGDAISNNGDIAQSFGQGDWWIFKINDNGDILWQNTLGQQAYDNANDLITTPDGHLLAVGNTLDPDLPPPNYLYDIRVAKLRQDNGNIVWQHRYGGSLYEFGNAILLSNNGNGIVVAGGTNSTDGDVNSGGGIHQPDNPATGLRHGMSHAWVFHLDEQIIDIPNIDNKQPTISVYPNPINSNNNKVNIQINDKNILGNIKIDVYNTAGQNITHLKTTANNNSADFQLDITPYPNGNYNIIINIDNRLYCQKLIIQHE